MQNIDKHELGAAQRCGFSVGFKFVGEWFITEYQRRKMFWLGSSLDVAYGEFDDAYIPGFLLLSLLDPLVYQAISDIDRAGEKLNYGFNRVRFPTLARPEDELRIRLEVTKIENRGNGEVITMSCAIENRSEDPVLVAEWLSYTLLNDRT